VTLVLLGAALIAFVGAAALAARAGDARAARRWAILGAAAGLLSSLTSLVLQTAGHPAPAFWGGAGAWGGLPAFVSAIGLIAVTLTPVTAVRPRTLARLLLVSAVSLAAGGVGHPVAVCGLWVLSMLPVWLELRAHPSTLGTARVFACYMVPSAVLIAAAGVLHGAGMPLAAVTVLALGIAIPEAVVPFHSWLPAFVERAPLGLAVVFVAPRLGVYTFLWLLRAQLPPGLGEAAAGLGAVTALSAAVLGVAQSRPRRALAYLMMSQSALFFLGFGTTSPVARTGALLMWIVVGLASAAFAMSVAALEARRGDLSLDRPGGNFARVPRLATSYLVCGLACVGLPGTIGFIAEDLVVQGTAAGLPVAGVVLITATALNAVNVVRGCLMLFMGAATHGGEPDLSRREAAVFALVMAWLFVTGVYPGAVVAALARHW
jgi:NADH-quinone oxidoreductase subunit M